MAPTDPVRVPLPIKVIYGRKTVTAAGTAEPLVASYTYLQSGITITALTGNTNNVYVGDSAVGSGNGHILDADDSIFLEIRDLNTVYIDTDTNGEGVSFIGS